MPPSTPVGAGPRAVTPGHAPPGGGWRPVIGTLSLLLLAACGERASGPLQPAHASVVAPERLGLYARLPRRAGLTVYAEEVTPGGHRLRGVYRGGRNLLHVGSDGQPALALAVDSVAAAADLPESQTLFVIHPTGPKTLGRPDTVRFVFGADCTYQTSDGRWNTERVLSATVHALENRTIWGSGGHGTSHARPKPVGRWSPSSGQFDGNGFFISLFKASVAAGDDSLVYALTPTAGPCTGDADTLRAFVATRVRGLVRIDPVPNLTITPPSSDHVTINYVIPEVRQAVYDMVARYFDATGGSDYVRMNAASTPLGGINDIANNWRPSHSTHRIGTDVDYDGRNDSPTTHAALIRAAQRSEGGGARKCERHGPRSGPPNHVHCYYGPPYLD